jgi:hypothetical protein
VGARTEPVAADTGSLSPQPCLLGRSSLSRNPCPVSIMRTPQPQLSHIASRWTTAADGGRGALSRAVLKEKAQADIDRVFKGTSRTRENLSVVDELLTYWKVSRSPRVDPASPLQPEEGWLEQPAATVCHSGQALHSRLLLKALLHSLTHSLLACSWTRATTCWRTWRTR